MVLCELLSGSIPFDSKSRRASDVEAHLRARVETDLECEFFSSPIWSDVSPPLKDFILTLLDEDPDERPSAQDAFQFLSTFHKIDNG